MVARVGTRTMVCLPGTALPRGARHRGSAPLALAKHAGAGTYQDGGHRANTRLALSSLKILLVQCCGSSANSQLPETSSSVSQASVEPSWPRACPAVPAHCPLEPGKRPMAWTVASSLGPQFPL